MGSAGMRRMAGWMLDVRKSAGEEAVSRRVRRDVEELCGHFPVPGIAA